MKTFCIAVLALSLALVATPLPAPSDESMQLTLYDPNKASNAPPSIPDDDTMSITSSLPDDDSSSVAPSEPCDSPRDPDNSSYTPSIPSIPPNPTDPQSCDCPEKQSRFKKGLKDLKNGVEKVACGTGNLLLGSMGDAASGIGRTVRGAGNAVGNLGAAVQGVGDKIGNTNQGQCNH